MIENVANSEAVMLVLVTFLIILGTGVIFDNVLRRKNMRNAERLIINNALAEVEKVVPALRKAVADDSNGELRRILVGALASLTDDRLSDRMASVIRDYLERKPKSHNHVAPLILDNFSDSVREGIGTLIRATTIVVLFRSERSAQRTHRLLHKLWVSDGEQVGLEALGQIKPGDLDGLALA